MSYSIISGLCVALLLSGSAYVVSRLMSGSRRERVEFVRTFKNGRCVFILLPTLIIVFMGLWYSNAGVYAIFKTVHLSMQFVVMDFEFGELQQLITQNRLYAAVVYLDCTLVIFNACMLAVSLFKQRVHCVRTNLRFLFTKADIVLIAGLGENNKAIYDSVPKDSATFIYCPLTKSQREELYNDGVEFLTLSEDRVLERICRIATKTRIETSKLQNAQTCNLFINTGEDLKNIALANNLIARIMDLQKSSEVAYERLAVYIFGSSNKKNLFLTLEEKGFGCIHYVDVHKQAVLDLIEHHPMASFFDERQVNYETTTVKNVELKVFLIGFGETNTELFLQSVSNDQFVTLDEKGRPVHKTVKYYLFDRKKILENSNLNYSYNRYGEFVKWMKQTGAQKDYFQIAQMPAEENMVPLQDIDCKTFFQKLSDNLARGDADINLISVSLGSDIDSVDFANKIASKCKEWKLTNTYTSVRIRDRKDCENIAAPNLLLWGDLKTAVFNYNAITRKELEVLAMIHDKIYDQYAAGKRTKVLDSIDEMRCRRAWFENKNRIKRESSFNACLNLNTKMCLMGVKNSQSLSGKEIKKLIDGLSTQARDNLARQEHYRWNAHYICSGYIPASINEIKECDDFGRSFTLRRHPNLLEFDELKYYENLTRDKVAQYDSMLIDNLADTVQKFEEYYQVNRIN